MKMMNVNKAVSTYDDIKCQSEDKQYSSLAQQSWINSTVIGLKIGKNMIFWRKIVIFHTKYPKHFRASLRSAQFF
jgi:hypothetical protein